MWIDQGMIESSVRAGGTVEIDLCEVGIVVLDHDGRVTSTNARARELLRAESQPALNERIGDLQRELTSKSAWQNGSMDESSVDLPGLGPLGVRGCDVAGVASDGRVLLLRDGRSLPSTATSSRAGSATSHLLFPVTRLGARPQGHAARDPHQ